MGTEQHKSLHVIEINQMDVMKKDIQSSTAGCQWFLEALDEREVRIEVARSNDI
jgi:hypothetical protein